MDSRSDKRTVTFELPSTSLAAEAAAIRQDDDNDFDPRSACMFIEVNPALPPTSKSPTAASAASAATPQDDDNDFDPLSASMFIEVNPAPPPVKHRPSSTYKTFQRLTSTMSSFHKISLVTKSPDAHAKFFYKENQQNSPFMPELESYSWGCYHLLTPRYVPLSTRAIYDINGRGDCYTGVSSKAISGFKSTKDAQLQECDLQLPLLNEGVSIEEMERLDQISLENPDFDTLDNEDTLTELQLDGNRAINVTVNDLKRYRIARGLGCSLTASYIFEEDDLHRGNISKQGDRIDFDMSIWPILAKFKSSGYIDGYVRKRNVENRFTVHANDIRSFPHLNHASPYYWPTKPINTSNQLVQIVSTNPWSAEENTVYQKLSQNPVFNHFKYQTLLKFVLTNADHYRAIAEMHIRPDLSHENKSIIEMLTEHQHARIQLIKNTLIAMPEFADFMEKNGSNAFNRIRAESEAANKRYENKIAKTIRMLETLEQNNHQNIIMCARKLNISYQNMSDRSIKEQILRALAAKKVAYQKQIIDIKKLTADFTALKNTVVDINIKQTQPQEQKTMLEQLQIKIQAEATADVSSAPTLSGFIQTM